MVGLVLETEAAEDMIGFVLIEIQDSKLGAFRVHATSQNGKVFARMNAIATVGGRRQVIPLLCPDSENFH